MNRRVNRHEFRISRLMFLWLMVFGCSTVASPIDGWPVDDVTFINLPKEMENRLTGGLAVTQRTGFLRTGRVPFRESDLHIDEERIRYFLARNGFPDATVTGKFTPVEDQKKIAITFTIETGQPVHIGQVTISGSPPDVEGLSALLGELMVSGDRFTDRAVSTAVTKLTEVLQQGGYACATAEAQLTPTAADSVAVTIKLTPGASYHFQSVSSDGIPDDLKNLVHRTVNISPGTRYNPDLITRARDRLRNLQLFRQIKIEPVPIDSTGLDLHSQLGCSPPRTARISIGSWSDDPWRVSASWQHRNLLLGGRGVEVAGAYSLFTRHLGATVWWPALLSPYSRLELSYGYDVEDEEAYYLTSSEVELANVYRFGFSTSLRLAVSLADVSVDNDEGADDEFTGEIGEQFVLSAHWLDESVDDLISPTRGSRLSAKLLYSPPDFISSSPFWSVESQVSRYLPIRHRWVLAGRLGFAMADALSDDDQLLPNRRFYAGGVTTHRGYKRRQLGPVNEANEPIGGEARVLASLELRFPIKSIIGGALFLDAGEVWRHKGEIDANELRFAGGVGLLIKTPVGPVRIDLGRKLSSPTGDLPRTVVHVAIGHPF
jgi:translocation and assembly module TamA